MYKLFDPIKVNENLATNVLIFINFIFFGPNVIDIRSFGVALLRK